MLVDKNDLLQKLPAFTNIKKVVKVNQGVTDIINGILQTHELYKKDYDLISDYFLGNNLNDTGKNIWQFLKKNVKYYVESDHVQTLRSPSAILALPADCKSYSLFSMGILDSLRRKGELNADLAFRFAGYDPYTNHLEHVFVVINPDTNKEIWVDAVLNSYNLHKEPSNYKDKKINNMALVGLSGIPDNRINGRAVSHPAPHVAAPSHRSVPKVIGGVDKSYKGGNMFMGSAVDDNIEGTQAMGATDAVSSLVTTASSFTNPASSISAAISLVSSLFPGHSDWWKFDQAYISGNYPAVAAMINLWGFGPHGGNDLAGASVDIPQFKGQPRYLTIPSVYAATKDQGVLNIWKQYVAAGLLPSSGLPSTSIFSSSTGTGTTPTIMGMNMYVTLALLGAGAFMIFKMKK